ncbi:MAG: hypothetical protein Rubg2KO_03450 [Rubricoccaceae bacterium]
MQADTTIAVLDTPAAQAITEQPPQGIERPMLAQDRLPVVLAVVLIVWIGILLLLIRTERRLSRVERSLDSLEAREPRTSSTV